ncbi:unnamed protein product [Calypogeia fissa]
MASNFVTTICCVFLLSTCASFTSGLLVEEPDSGKIHIDFLHRDHFMSPLSDPQHSSLADRTLGAVRRSHARRQSFATLQDSGRGRSTNSSVSAGVEAPVQTDNGEYVMTGSIGTPPVKFVAIVDSGSDLIWLQCKQCKTCLHQVDPLFDPKKSRSFRRLSCSNQFCKDLPISSCSANSTENSACDYTYGYGDGSFTRGILASETARLPTRGGQPYPMKDIAFGCGFDNEGYFAGVDGLVGFGRGPLSLPSQIGSQVGRVFSYCLGDFASATNQSSTLSIGKDPNEDFSEFKFTKLISNPFYPTFYYIRLESIRVGRHKLNISEDTFSIDNSTGIGGTIIDSGTTITYLPDNAYEAVLNHVLTAVAYPVVKNSTATIGLDLCFNVSGIATPRLPAVILRFSGATLRLPTENTFITLDMQGSSLTCLAMASSGLGGFSIFGNYQQQNFEIVCDLERSRLGFRKKECIS